MEIDHEYVVKRVIELSGGRKKLHNKINADVARINEKWEQDIDSIGRILRAHLFVEHFVNDCLVSFNPNLGNIKQARLTFSQKLSLIENYSEETKELSRGIRRLNKVRNQLAHNLAVTVTDEDKESFLSIHSFNSIRKELAKPELPSEDNLVVLEDFAKYVAGSLAALADSGSLGKIFEQVFSELQK